MIFMVGREDKWIAAYLTKEFLGLWFSKCSPWISIVSSPGNLLQMQILGAHPRSSKSESTRGRPSNLCFSSPPGAPYAPWLLRSSAPEPSKETPIQRPFWWDRFEFCLFKPWFQEVAALVYNLISLKLMEVMAQSQLTWLAPTCLNRIIGPGSSLLMPDWGEVVI